MGEDCRTVEEKLRALAERLPVEVDPWEVLDLRDGLRHRGRTSFGGATRLLRTADNWIALSLARPEDAAAVFALLERADVGDAWRAVMNAARDRSALDLVARGRLLGMPIAALAEVTPENNALALFSGVSSPMASADLRELVVVDLSAMWAGPLCGALLARAGAHVIKVESPDRPDGARRGSQPLFEALNGAKHQVTYDFTSPDFRALLEHADVVIEASRPRALEQLGIHADEFLEHHHPTVWLSITGYGRGEPEREWVAFGDDAAVAGALVARDDTDGGPLFYGDAIADPLTGMVATAALTDALTGGAPKLIDVPMAAVAAYFASTGTD
jgi:crotonobetainyl-CoA:carnitine CoA-transferase CaiB-like acyl-CoA transferase